MDVLASARTFMREAIMPQTDLLRRDIIGTLLAGLPLPAFDWDAMPDAKATAKDPDRFDCGSRKIHSDRR